MRLSSGRLMMAIGIIHTGLVLGSGHAEVAGVIRDGMFGTVSLQGGPYSNMFWAAMTGLAWILVGAMFGRLEAASGQPLPAVAGAALVGIGALGAMMAPTGGFWLIMALGGLILWRSRKNAATTTATSGVPSSRPPGSN